MLKIILPCCIGLLFLTSCPGPYPKQIFSVDTVKIGAQVWQSKNLDITTYRDGSIIPQAINDSAWLAFSKSQTGCWCYYKDSVAYGNLYGRLYSWYAVNNPKGLAPAGWHIPTGDEWDTLIVTMGGAPRNDSIAGEKLKSIDGWNNRIDGTTGNGTNTSRFNGLPGGGQYLDLNLNAVDSFFGAGYYSSFWTSDTVPNTTNGKEYSLHYNNNGVNRDGFAKGDCLSVRCIKD